LHIIAGVRSQLFSLLSQRASSFSKTTPLPIKGILSNQGRGGFDITQMANTSLSFCPAVQAPGSRKSTSHSTGSKTQAALSGAPARQLRIEK
jgi:hypothetical protein